MGALFALAGALCYSELGVNVPTSGGEYVYLRQAYGPVWGFLSGWVSIFAGFSAPIAAAALAFAGYLAFIFPSLGQESSTLKWDLGGITWQIGVTQAIAAGLVLISYTPQLRRYRPLKSVKNHKSDHLAKHQECLLHWLFRW